jgi:CHAD domain-containing protein
VTTEREVKLGVWPGFTMPSLDGVAAGTATEALPPQRLEATYYDTASLALARMGVTLRYRTGEDDGDVWTLKLPKGSGGSRGVLARDEIEVSAGPNAIPAVLRDRIAAWVRSARVAPVARLQTARERADVVGNDGKRLAEIVDDEVSVLDGRHVALRFREVEVELAPDAEEAVLDELVARLRAAGAGAPDPTPKVIRALGPRALTPPDLVVGPLPKEPTGGDLVRIGIARSVARIIEHDAGVRAGDDIEAVHQARVGARRLRSDLRTLAPLVDDEWRGRIEGELRWLGELLGNVRDLDVQGERMAASIASVVPEDPAAGGEILAVIAAQRDRARAATLRGLRSKRYIDLLDELVRAATDPRVVPSAARGADALAPALARRPWRRLAKAVVHAGAEPSDETLHAIRKRAKRARYAAEMSALVVGEPATRFAKALAGVQEVLGDHQDACVQRTWLRENVGALSPRAALLAGQLVARADDAAMESRDAWRAAWSRTDRRRLHAWLSR